MDISIYSEDFDKFENVVNGGFGGKVFLDDTLSGKSFDNLDSAFKFVLDNGITNINHLIYNYLSNDIQYQRVII